MKKVFLIMAGVCLFGCAKPGPEEPLSSSLKTAVTVIKNHSSCRTIIPLEWPQSWPVPAELGGGVSFEVFFYPLEGAAGEAPIVFAPRGAATFNIKDGHVASCRRFPDNPTQLPGRRWTRGIERLDDTGFSSMEARLYDRTESVAALYSSRRPLSETEKVLVSEYLDLFESLAEPALVPFYYRLNENFWDWVRKVNGRSIPVG